MKIKKAEAQYYAEFIERSIYLIGQGSICNPFVNFNFPIEDVREMSSDAELIFRTHFLDYTEIEYTGRKTSLAAADFICDGNNVELKYVGVSKTGTYFNTTLYYCCNVLGFTDYREYLEAYHVLKPLEEIGYDQSVLLKNGSPVTQTESSLIRHQMPEIYNRLVSNEKSVREKYVSDFYQYLIDNNLLHKFYMDMLMKYSKNAVPDKIVVFNHNSKKSFEIDLTKLINHDGSCISNVKGSSIVFDNIRCTFSWQNGICLNNPTIRVFLI